MSAGFVLGGNFSAHGGRAAARGYTAPITVVPMYAYWFPRSFRNFCRKSPDLRILDRGTARFALKLTGTSVKIRVRLVAAAVVGAGWDRLGALSERGFVRAKALFLGLRPMMRIDDLRGTKIQSTTGSYFLCNHSGCVVAYTPLW